MHNEKSCRKAGFFIARSFFHSISPIEDRQNCIIVVVKKTLRYSNVFFYNRTRVYAAIPQLRNFEHYNEKRYRGYFD
jgi:hypothetical protein